MNLSGKDSSSAGRAGLIRRSREIPTPIFMPVGTAGSVKAVTGDQLTKEIHAKIILGNTYHLYLRPGTEVLENAGGLHRFMNWNRPILTDSGGYQVFSLAGTRKISEEGVMFKSHIDGSPHMFSPEKVMDIQRSIGGDIMMAFDECPGLRYRIRICGEIHASNPSLAGPLYQPFSMQHPTDMAIHRIFFRLFRAEVLKIFDGNPVHYIASQDAPGNAIGGLSVGEPEEELYAMTALCCEHLPVEKPRYLMGVGTPWNLLECISLGIDMFDCVMPTRNGRNGMLFTSQGSDQYRQ